MHCYIDTAPPSFLPTDSNARQEQKLEPEVRHGEPLADLQAATIAAAAAAQAANDAAKLVYALFTNDPSLPLALDQVGLDAYALVQAALAASDAGSYDTALAAGQSSFRRVINSPKLIALTFHLFIGSQIALSLQHVNSGWACSS